MKTLGKLAIIFAAIFIVAAVIGGICIGLGAAELAASDQGTLDQITDALNNIGGIQIDGGDISISKDDWFTVDFTNKIENVDDDVKKIVVDGAICEMTVKRGDNNDLSVSYKGKSLSSTPFTLKESGSGITVDFSKFNNGNSISARSINAKITVLLPKDYAGSLELNGCLGEVNLNSGADALDKLGLYGTLGEISVHGAFSSIELNGCLGEVEIESTQAFTKDSEIQGTLGEVTIELPVGAALNIEDSANLGAVRIRGIVQDANAPMLEIQGNMGEVTIEAEK